jgi:hypothetical protein
MRCNLPVTSKHTAYTGTLDWRVRPAFTCCVLLLVLAVSALQGPARGEDLHTEPPAAFRFDLTEGWFDRPVHSHFSRLGTPMIHSFHVEPAFTRQDLLLDYSTRSETGRNEQEISAELEWPLSRRLGLIFEIPYVFVDTDDGGPIDSFGNLAISPRVLLAEYERFLLAFNLEVETTTGDTDAGIAEDEVALGPSLSTWLDLGNWWALNAQSGFEYPVESTDAEFFVRSALIHTFGVDEVVDRGHSEHEHDGEPASGLVSLVLEADLFRPRGRRLDRRGHRRCPGRPLG